MPNNAASNKGMQRSADITALIFLNHYSRPLMPGVRLLLVMNLLKSKYPLILPALYLLAVVACILLAFDFEGAINTTWTLVLIGLTLPWGLVSILFAWALIHGAGLEFFTFMYLVFAGINAFILYRLCSAAYKRRKNVEV